MKYLNLFPTVVGGSILSQKVISNHEKWIEYISKAPSVKFDKYNDWLTKDERLLDDSTFLLLKNNILTKAKEYLNNVSIVYENIEIVNSWGVIVEENNAPRNKHFHANALISGVYYLTDGSPIEFHSPLTRYNSLISNNANQNYQIPPQEGLLIFFPNYLEHHIQPYKGKGSRVSIAFNIIPRGEFGPPKAKIWL